MATQNDKCYLCGKEGKLQTAIIEGVERLVCDDCIDKLRKKWMNWYSE